MSLQHIPCQGLLDAACFELSRGPGCKFHHSGERNGQGAARYSLCCVIFSATLTSWRLRRLGQTGLDIKTDGE